MRKKPPDPDAFLPLKPHWFHVLLSLANQEQHGYGIMQEVLERTAGKVRVWPATLYGTLKRLIDIGTIAFIAVPLFRSMQKRTDRINQVMREVLGGMRVIRAFVRTEHEEKRYDDANQALTDNSLKVARLFALMIPFLFGIMNLSMVAIVWFGGLRIDSGSMPIGNL